jgi:hypothetical protein
MEPDYTWRLAFLVLGVALPFGIIAADVAWFGADVIVILACLIWFGFFFMLVEGVTRCSRRANLPYIPAASRRSG